MRRGWIVVVLWGMLATAQVAVEPIRPSSFADVARYLEPNGDAYVYLNSDQFATKVLEFSEAIGEAIMLAQPKERPQFQRTLKALRQLAEETGALEIKGMGMSSARKGGMQSGRTVLFHGDTQPTGRLWQIGGGKPHAFTGLSMMPKTTVAAFTGDCRLDLLWESLDALAATIGPDARDGLRELRKALAEYGDLDATMAAFTGEITLIVTLDTERSHALDCNPDVQIPELSILLSLGVKAPNLHGAFETLFGAHPQLEHLEIPGATAFALRPEQEQAFRWWPTFAKTEGRFIFASNPDIVKSVLNVPIGEGIATSAEFQQLQTGMPTEGNQLTFVSRRLSDELGRIAKALAPETELPPPFQMLGVTVRHDDAMVAYSKQSADIATALPTTFSVVATAWSSQALTSAYARLKADDRPITMDDLLPEPPNDNAAPHYEDAFAALEDAGLTEPLRELAVDILSGQATAEGHDEWRGLVARDTVADALEATRLGSSKRFFKDLDWNKGPAMVLPHIGGHRKLLRIVCANAVDLAHNDKVEEGWSELAVALSLSDALVDEPLLISQLVRSAEFTICRDAMMQIAKHGPPNADQAVKLDAFYARFETTTPMARAMDGDRVGMGGWSFANHNPAMLDGVNAPVWMAPIAMFGPLMELDHAFYLNALGSYANNLEQPLEKIDRKLETKIPPYSILSRMILPAVSSATSKAVESATSARMGRLALAAIRHHADTGKYPSTLAELRSPLSQVDPFSGRAFTYESDERGFRIGSVGKNGELFWQVEAK